MTQARKTIVSLNDTPYYHCTSRCVRRAFLCGIDRYSKQNYEHRRQWLEDKLLKTAEAFAIRLCSYAVMSNHYHVVIHLRPDIADSWTDRDVVKHWHMLFSGTLFSQQYLANEKLGDAQRQRLAVDIALWRERLCDLSWYMRIVNEAIAREANKEDECTGRFWEGRFKSQAMLDERALLGNMTYADLNPVRAKMADTPEESDHTCVKARIDAMGTKTQLHSSIEKFVGGKPDLIGIPFTEIEYLELVDWSGRIVKEGKRGAIDDYLPPILERLSITREAWFTIITEFEDQFKQWVGTEEIVRKVYKDKNYQRIPSTAQHRALLG